MISKPWSGAGDDMAERNRTQEKSKKAMTKKARLRKEESEIMSLAGAQGLQRTASNIKTESRITFLFLCSKKVL